MVSERGFGNVHRFPESGSEKLFGFGTEMSQKRMQTDCDWLGRVCLVVDSSKDLKEEVEGTVTDGRDFIKRKSGMTRQRNICELLTGLKMVVKSFLLAAALCCWCHGADTNTEGPAVSGPQEGLKMSNLLPELDEPDVPPTVASRGRSDVEIETEEEEEAPRGYFYPKPAIPFNLPEFKTLDASFTQEDDPALERLPRSPRRRPYFPSPPPFIPGWIPPQNNIRPLPALYGRPGRF